VKSSVAKAAGSYTAAWPASVIVRELLGVRMDALARKFHETHDMKVKDELERLLKEYGKLKEPWVFRVI
jgi:hypothetical protein